MNNHIITITGDLGSGKSSVAKKLCNILGYTYLSTGILQRKIAREKGMNTLELNKYSENNSEIDNYIDQTLINLNNESESYILDSRLAWHFVKNSFKIYLLALPEVAAYRVSKDHERTEEPSADDISSIMANLKDRRVLENNRFKKLYNIETDKFKNYDLIIDTTTASVSEVSELIVTIFKKWKSKENFNKIWLSPQRIYPTENIRLLASSDAKDLTKIIEKEGYNNEYPIETILYNKNFYVWNGHKRLSATLFNKVNLIPVRVIAKDEENIIPSLNAEIYAKSSFNISWIYDWEDAHKFRFFHYPETNLEKNEKT